MNTSGKIKITTITVLKCGCFVDLNKRIVYCARANRPIFLYPGFENLPICNLKKKYSENTELPFYKIKNYL